MDTPRGRFIYLVSEGLPPTVIESQVVSVLARLADRGLVFDLFVYQLQAPRPEWTGDERLREIQRHLPGRVRLWPWPARTRSVTAVPPEGQTTTRRPLLRGSLNRLALEGAYGALQALLLTEVSRSILRGEPIVVHGRGEAAELALRLKRWSRRFRVVADIRGDAVAEHQYVLQRRGISLESRDAQIELAAFRAAERRIVRQADSVQCVSHALRRRLEAETGVAPGKIRVLPCLADERRFRFDADERLRLRRELGVTDRTVLVYSGSMSAWQDGAGMLRLFVALRERLPALHLFLLTPDLAGAEDLLHVAGLSGGEGVTARSVRHADVAGYLSASDVGLLLREPHPLNRVASPTKFAEYALCGLPVLASPGIGDLDDVIAANDLGTTASTVDDLTAAERWLRTQPPPEEGGPSREARARRATSVMGLGAHIDEIIREYVRLADARDTG